MKKKVVKTSLDGIDLEPQKEITPHENVCLDVFKPTKKMRKAKAMLMANSKGMPGSLEMISMEEAIALTGMKEIRNYWRNKEFYNWFIDAHSHMARIDYLLHRQIDNLEDIIEDDEEVHTVRDKTTAGKQLLDIKKSFEKDEGAQSELEQQMMKMLEKVVTEQLEGPKVPTKALGKSSVDLGEDSE